MREEGERRRKGAGGEGKGEEKGERREGEEKTFSIINFSRLLCTTCLAAGTGCHKEFGCLGPKFGLLAQGGLVLV